MNEDTATFTMTNMLYDLGNNFVSHYRGFIGGWYLPCKTKGYPIICLNHDQVTSDGEENICLYVDGEYGEVMLSLETEKDPGTSFYARTRYTTGLDDNASGWHVFGIAWDGIDDNVFAAGIYETYRTDITVFFGG